MRRLISALVVVLVWCAAASAQTAPGFVLGSQPTAAQWNGYFGGKADTVNGLLTSPTINGGTLNNLSSLTATGNATLGGTLGVTGAATIGDTLNVTGPATIGGALGVTGAFSLSTAPSVASLTGSIVSNMSVYGYPTNNERARYWSTVLTVTGTATMAEENNFFNYNLTIPGAASGFSITAAVNAGSVQSPLMITNPGSGLPNGTYPLYFLGGGGSGAAGTATVSSGSITSTTLSSVGSGYTSPPGIGVEIGITTNESNIVHPYGQIDPGVYFSSSEIEPFEASFLNNGTMLGSYQGLNALFANGPSGLTPGEMMGVHLGVINDNPIAGSMAEYDAIYLQPWSGSGSKPSAYYMLKNPDPAASISTLGGVNIGNLAPNETPGDLGIYGQNTLSSDCPLVVRNASANISFITCNDLTASFPAGFITLGTGGNWGRIIFGNTASGTIQLSAPASGALGSSTLTMPAVTDTLAVLGAAQTFTGALTFSGGITLASSTTGAATQTFTNSPCTGLTAEKWVPITIVGQTGTFYVPACQ